MPSDNESDGQLKLLQTDYVIESKDDCDGQLRILQPVLADVTVMQQTWRRLEPGNGLRNELYD